MAKTENELKQVQKASRRPILVALDLGYGWTKILSSAGINFTYPSMAVPGVANTKLFRLSEIDRRKMIVTVDGGTWLVGDYAKTKSDGRTTNRTEERDRVSDPKSRVLYRTGIALGVPDEEGEYDVIIETGVPNEEYFWAGYMKRLEDFLRESFEITFDLGQGKSVTKKINVVDVHIIRQPEGTVLNSQFQFNPNYGANESEPFLNQIDDTDKFFGVIDIGQGTTDYALFDGVSIRNDERSSGSTEATNAVYDKLRTSLSIRFSEEGRTYKPTDSELDTMIRTKSLWYAQDTHDVSEEVSRAVSEVAELLVDEVTRSWKDDINRLQSILITGGGAEAFYDALVEAFKSRKITGLVKANFAQYSNVLGFYQMGVLHQIDLGLEVDSAFESYVKPLLEMLGEAE